MLATRALALKLDVLRPGHPEILESRLEVAKVQAASGDVDGAQEVLVGLYEALAESLGPEHARTRAALALNEELDLAGATS